jgi:hypothetical protein
MEVKIMAQLTIYIDDETLARVERSARKEKGSVSAWVKKRLTGSLSNDWPAGYFNVFGSLKEDGSFVRPPQPDARADRKREIL